MRLDKWLWVSRFYKTRAVATEAVNGGKVHLNGDRCKPGKLIRVGDQLRVRKGAYEYTVEILDLAKQRGPAKLAQQLYKEDEVSIQARENQRSLLKTASFAMPKTVGKPNKQTRRELIKHKQRQDYKG